MSSSILLTVAVQVLYALHSTQGLPTFCSLKPDAGFCMAYMPRFYYDAGDKTCKQFIYGGCQGNKNNFLTLQECQKTCNSQDPCAYVSCQFGGKCQVETGVAKCQCPQFCTLEYLPVCGHDGKEYSNLCALRVAECKTQKEIKYDEGHCH